MAIAVATHTLRFKHPFGTAHGVRHGTEAVYLKVHRGSVTGHGEVTLPPYCGVSTEQVLQELQALGPMLRRAAPEPGPSFRSLAEMGVGSATRSLIVSAFCDLISREMDCPISSLLEIAEADPLAPPAMVTLGHTEPSRIADRLAELPVTPILKVKLGGPHDEGTLRVLDSLVDKHLFFDGNQGIGTVDRALELISMVAEERIVGFEQPFGRNDLLAHRALKERTRVRIYADESIQGPVDLERCAQAFSGINIKLLKCGGLDEALRMLQNARQAGLKVMPGCMSEGSLGCGTLAHLAPGADLLDLDGPWLVSNDPFEGLEMSDGSLRVRGAIGNGISLRESSYLNWSSIGA